MKDIVLKVISKLEDGRDINETERLAISYLIRLHEDTFSSKYSEADLILNHVDATLL